MGLTRSMLILSPVKPCVAMKRLMVLPPSALTGMEEPDNYRASVASTPEAGRYRALLLSLRVSEINAEPSLAVRNSPDPTSIRAEPSLFVTVSVAVRVPTPPLTRSRLRPEIEPLLESRLRFIRKCSGRKSAKGIGLGAFWVTTRSIGLCGGSPRTQKLDMLKGTLAPPPVTGLLLMLLAVPALVVRAPLILMHSAPPSNHSLCSASVEWLTTILSVRLMETVNSW